MTVSDQQAIDKIIDRLEGRTIIRAGVDVYEEGFHLELDDGVFLVCMGVVALYRKAKETLQ